MIWKIICVQQRNEKYYTDTHTHTHRINNIHYIWTSGNDCILLHLSSEFLAEDEC